LRETALAEGKISAPDLGLVHLTDDPDEVVRILADAFRERGDDA
jgi:hypothetical protein